MRKALIFLAVCLFLGTLQPGFAQVPTEEQLELLREMSPEDREALMEQLGLGSSAMGGLGSNGDDREGSRGDRRGNNSRDGQLTDAQFIDDKLDPDDSILLDIAHRKDIPPQMIEPAAPGMPPTTVPGETAPALEPEERKELDKLITLIQARNPYQLDANGALNLPGFPPIMLAGLNDEQASKRLAAVNAFLKLSVKVTRLPVRKVGTAGLKPFGSELFRNNDLASNSGMDVPVPADYIVGPGDRINVQLFGTQNRNVRLTVGRDGRINFPVLGPINVTGRSFDRVRAEIEQRVEREMIGVRASVGMVDTRSIQVFVMGEANRPGSYSVSGLATITSALYSARGIKPIGSMRDVQLKRQGAVVRRLDLYDLLLRGDTSNDAKLQPGDVIFIPPRSLAVAVDGEVQRPAIYELKHDTTLAETLQLAGGPTTEADTSRVAVVRVNEQRSRVVLDVPLDTQGSSQTMRNGDALRVLRLRPTLDEGVTVEGHVFRPGPFAWRKGLRIADVLPSVDELKPGADIRYVLIRRELPPDRRIAAVSADLSAALGAPGSPANIELQPRDRVLVFDGNTDRQQLMAPLLEDLRRQSSIQTPSEIVRIDGRVKRRGDYPLEPNMRISDLLRAGGGLEDAAYGAKAELARYRLDVAARQTELLEVDLQAILAGNQSADLTLRPFDFLNVKEVPEWSEQEQVTISGEVRFPGTYPIKRGETLRSVLDRAGGLSPLAFPSGAVFTRKELQMREQQQIDRLAERLQSDLASASLQAVAANQGDAAQALSVGQALLNQLKQTKAVGRLVIDINSVLAAPAGSPVDVVLRGGDLLSIPKQKQEVTVIGEVQTTTSHFFREPLSRDDYIGMSGGLTRKADRGRIYVVRADGSVVSSEGTGWFRRSAQVAMKPGDTIVVPLDTERMPALPLWQAVTQILYNLAISAAAVQSF